MKHLARKLLPLAALLALAIPARATDGIWYNTTTTGTFNWSDAANWYQNAVPNGVDDTALFAYGGTGTQTINVGTVTLGGIRITNGIPFFAAGGTITFQSSTGTATIENTVNGTSFNTSLVFNSATTVDTGYLDSLIFQTSMTGSGVITKVGLGTLDIGNYSSTNYSGTMVINQGGVWLTPNGTSFVNATVTVNNGGTLTDGSSYHQNSINGLTVNEGGIVNLGNTTINGTFDITGGTVKGSAGYGLYAGTATTINVHADSVQSVFSAEIDTTSALTFNVERGTTTGSDLNFSSAFKAASTTGITKTGAGIMQWSATSTTAYTGTTTVKNGTLQVTGLIASTGATKIIADTGVNAVLTGTGDGSTTGKINGATTIGGGLGTSIVDAGSTGDGSTTIGTMVFATTLAFGTNSTLRFELNSTTKTIDLLKVTGAASLGSGLALLSGSDLGNSALTLGTKFTLLSAASVSGTFQGLAEGSTFTLGSNLFQISYLNNAVTLTAVAVPEPSTWVLLGLGSLAVARVARRKAGGLAASV
ncbi:PEP-CTERM protein-sorting domain-containing protein [Verrucomicrobium sp. GAS474]|uniref:PEP-CTERM sorting domain-containing protein n=1 Tax=Verrucomicrobium sp. GAS474 TaxID=1882831 RepID=UPI000879DE14|nr:PEP-CTERM sorting domain-containing protein [Verrucomicrobium sp. GAS474]SDT95594.1 PEP-CTERM protein-sorting domain-containing protein [Verrucomicrobium sp. GAS474]